MTKKQIEDKVEHITRTQLFLGHDSERYDRESTFADMGADSLDAVELLMEVENEFVLEIPDDDAEMITTPAAAVEYLSARMAAK